MSLIFWEGIVIQHCKEKKPQDISKPVENSFYFAGEYATENSSSTVDAALQSGQNVAGKILRGKMRRK